MTFPYLIKALYAGLTVFLGGVGAILVGDATFGSITQGQWVFIASAVVVAIGGVLRLQAAPATVATGIKSD